MVGVLNRDRLFEYISPTDFTAVMDNYASKYGDSNVIIISDAQDQIKCIIANEEFVFNVDLDLDIQVDTNYYVRLLKINNIRNVNFPEKNDKLNSKLKKLDFKTLKVYNGRGRLFSLD